MRHPAFQPIMLAATVIVATLAAGCGSSSDDAAKFAGDWTINPGMAMCAAPAIGFELTGLAVTIAKIDTTTITLSAGASCSVRFKVSGATATADSGQSCTLDTPLGPQTIMVASWTLVSSGDQITNNASGMAMICAVTVTGTLVKATVDAGASG